MIRRLIILLLIVGCGTEPEDCAGVAGGTNICGCNDTTALNYDSTATFNDGSCEFDTTAPTVVIAYPVNSSTLTETTTVTVDVADDGKLCSILLY